MSVDPLSSALTSSAASSGTSGGSQSLGQNEFLKLMVAQLKNQDPTKPLDPTQFVSQLAQFSTVTSVQNMQTSMDNLVSSVRSSQVLDGSSLIGRSVLAPVDTTSFTSGGTLAGSVDVPSGTTGVQVQVQDSTGQTVRTFSVVPQTGLTDFTWDGRTDTGVAAPSGTYTLKIVGSAGGENFSLDPLLTSRVNSVTMDSSTSELALNTNNGTLALSDVRRVF